MSPTRTPRHWFCRPKICAPNTFGCLFVAAYAIDLLYFLFLALGIDKLDYDPWSHSLLMAIVWSAVAGLIALFFSRKFRSGLVIGLVVFSHWILDIIVWDNIPIFFDKTQRVGLGLYSRIGFSLTGLTFGSGTIIAASLELGMLLAGLATYILFLRKSRGQPGVFASK